uniref:Ig-like domain-containing protein n=1 Tax=Chrysemys picta bellii TaxID=8478 RepID=A0A8C3FB81_CHRPI
LNSSQGSAVLGDSVQPREPQMSGVEGGSVTLSCSYESSYTAGVYLYWYRQYPNRAPQYILRRGTKGARSGSDTADFAQERFSSHIEAVSLQDRAVYYCALRPTLGKQTPLPSPHFLWVWALGSDPPPSTFQGGIWDSLTPSANNPVASLIAK